MMFFVFLKAPFTGGEDGLQGVPRGTLFGLDLSDDTTLYYVVLAITIFGLWVIHRAIHSPFGEILKAIRENEARVTSLGYDIARYKLLAFVLSAGLAGAAKVLVFKFATLADVHWHVSGEVVLMTLLGGVGTVIGPMLGAGVVVVLQNGLADKVGSFVTIIIGVIFILCVLTFRRGIAGELNELRRRVLGDARSGSADGG
ncbi:ABC-type branched-subunit amino acid transport system permease subunit [Azospirillum agricola]|uniref:branched-chain amino acid ABC transporter permease n=1 Tax=Azospirillum agricola TaxID=1720247 RepID=UPI001AE83EC9|nr:ABC-type branched-subunit amino acid transport system permease subunit [Azospirillum agricola]